MKFFVAVFSALTIFLFYTLISSNGVILGNDPAVHLAKAYEMLENGKVSVSEITWYPPLYRIILVELMSFTGATNFEHALFLTKALTVTLDWLLIFSVYLLGARLLNEGCGIIASSLMLLCFPLYEINFWGGYPSLLSIVYLCLMLFYLPSKRESYASKVIIFLTAFAIVLTHQFTTFLTFILLILYAVITFLIFRSSSKRLLLIAILGASVAFILWYVPIMMPYMNILITHVFFSQRQYLYLVKRVSLDVFLLNFGFILFFALFGALLTIYECKKRKETDFYILLSLSFFVPLLFTQSYILNLTLPYDRFVYYMMPPAVIFSAAVIYLLIKFITFRLPKDKRKGLRHYLYYLKDAVIISIIIWLLASRFPALTSKVSEATEYYSYVDLPAYQAGLWLKNNFHGKSTVIVTEKPGLFFGMISGKSAVMETDPIVERNALAETVLNLAYEMENPLMLFRVYEVRMPYELDRCDLLEHNVWRRASFLYDEESSLSYTENDGEKFYTRLSDLARKIIWVDGDDRKTLQVQYYSQGNFILAQNIEMWGNRIPINFNWTFTSLNKNINDLKIYLSIHFDLYFSFEKAYVPGVLNWENPWDNPSFQEENKKWVLTYFSPENLTKNHIAIYDSTNMVLYAVKFANLPSLGSVGALSSKQIDALRLRYDFESVNQTISFAYWVLNFSAESFQRWNLDNFEELFDFESKINVHYRDYLTYIKEYQIQFMVFGVENFRIELLNSRLLQLIYSNNKYVVCKIVVDLG
ncbi:MAG: hypothetical protein QW146_02880 [Candidatus Bathyarchaeia archaeon]